MILQLLQVVYAHYFLAVGRIFYNEIAKTEVVFYGFANVDGQLLGIFVDERAVELCHVAAVLGVARLHDYGQIGVLLTQIVCELESGFLVLLAIALKRDVAYHAQHVVAIFVIDLYGFLVVARKHHLWASAHAQHRLVAIESLG